MHPLNGHKEDTNLSEGDTLTIEMDFLSLTARAFFVFFCFKYLTSIQSLAVYIQRGDVYK